MAGNEARAVEVEGEMMEGEVKMVEVLLEEVVVD